MKAHVLVVDDERLIRTSLERALAGLGHETEAADSLAAATGALTRTRFDLVVLDLKLPDGSGLDVVRRLAVEAPETKVVVISAHGTVDIAVEAMKLGAFDFVQKPFELDELLGTAGNALRAGALERRVAYHDERDRSRFDADMIPGRAPSMMALERELAMVAPQPVPVVLVVGETGSGKALVARRLHYNSPRAGGPFVELNAAAIPDTLVESELFGHERGAFSDARERKLGLVEVADGGTLFLDEIGELPAPAQAKLLSFLESFSFRRVGATASRTVDVRLVAATNRDLALAAKEGRFRQDLYYRLAAITLRLPPLRARREDIRPLAAHFLAGYAQRYGKQFREVGDEAAALLEAWPWPGNVRELKSIIQRAVLMNDAPTLETRHLPVELVDAALDPVPGALAGNPARIATLDEIDLRYMRAVLRLTGGNKVRAAEHLGITRQTLAKRLGESD
ncbi:MAG TPA: sigma-54 dependent transcriptional regulator [Polyangia bacterium]|nr:sigma-54 dependent transcriptional regulator [Polyangia bacterium]